MTGRIRKVSQTSLVPQHEQGMAMVMALLMGVVLLAGATGLMIRQMMARKLGAAESYSQLAESAALNGLNRIISDLNKDDRDNYTGFLLTLRNDPEQWGWISPNMPSTADTSGTQLVELCTPVDRFISAYPQGTEGEAAIIPINTSNVRADGIKEEIQVGYRLRSYNTTATGGNGEGSFYVEGIVRRGENVLARALLKRALFISSRVAGAGDWAVMSGHNLRLNDTTINGPGNIFYLTKSPDDYAANAYSSKCFGSLLDDVGTSNSDLAGPSQNNQIWPINIDETKRGVSGLPPTNLFEKERQDDTTKNSNGGTIRIWSFDDSDPAPADRDGDGLNDLEPDGLTEIRYPALPCGEAVCVRDADDTGAEDFRTLAEEGINLSSSTSTITLSKDILCRNSEAFDCHVYLDHVNLSTTKLHLETSDTRSIVLHLDQPVSYPTNLSLSQAITLRGSAELCGVNAGSSSCNSKPEQLVITASAGTAPTTDACGREAQSVSFTGATLPNALIYLPTGIVRPNDATLTGLVWASSICVLDDDNTAASFTLTTEQNGVSVVQKANDLWGWSERFNYPGYGRMVTRAIRGTSLDIFERW
jgi:hypothetical protein